MKPKLTIQFRVMRTDKDTVTITPICDETKVKLTGLRINDCLTVEVREDELKPVERGERIKY